MATEREVRVDSILEYSTAQLVEPLSRALRERLIGKVAQRRTAPERKRSSETVRCRRRLPVTQEATSFVR